MTENKKFDLEERTALFSEKSIIFCKKLPKNSTNSSLISQFIRSATSIGSNYCEADCAESKKDFIHKIGICKKEAKECRYWLRIMKTAFGEFENELKLLWQEAHELQLIFIAIVKKTKENISAN